MTNPLTVLGQQAAVYPTFLAASFASYQERFGLDAPALAQLLGLADPQDLAYLALHERPLVDPHDPRRLLSCLEQLKRYFHYDASALIAVLAHCAPFQIPRQSTALLDVLAALPGYTGRPGERPSAAALRRLAQRAAQVPHLLAARFAAYQAHHQLSDKALADSRQTIYNP